MTVFITKTWGFGEPCGPLQFSAQGWRDRARDELVDGDLVIIVGTMQEPTAEEEQGRILGIMEPSKQPVASLDFDLEKAPQDFDEEGNYRWPYALLNRRAWIFEDRPFLNRISDRSFHMPAALGIVPLTEDEAATALSFRHREVELLAPIRARARVEGDAAARRRAAPPPTTTRTGVMHIRHAPAYTYCMEVEGGEARVFKIGWAFDYDLREQQFNQAALPEIGGIRYRTKLKHLWDTAHMAFAMEQWLLNHFDDARHRKNREVVVGVSFENIEKEWISYIWKFGRKRRFVKNSK